MSANYSFVGEVNRNNAMGAVADTMNELNLDILKATMEMGGKQVVEKDGKAYALERLDDSEVKDLKDFAVKLYLVNEQNCTLGENGQFYNAGEAVTEITHEGKIYTWDGTHYKHTVTQGSPAVLFTQGEYTSRLNSIMSIPPIPPGISQAEYNYRRNSIMSIPPGISQAEYNSRYSSIMSIPTGISSAERASRIAAIPPVGTGPGQITLTEYNARLNSIPPVGITSAQRSALINQIPPIGMTSAQRAAAIAALPPVGITSAERASRIAAIPPVGTVMHAEVQAEYLLLPITTFPSTSYQVTPITDADTAADIFDILGINPSSDIDGKLEGNNWKITLSVNPDGGVTMNVAYKDANTGDFMGIAVTIDSEGKCTGLSELRSGNASGSFTSLDEALNGCSIVGVDGGGLLESWGISDPEELQPGDLFLVQQKLQIIKDTVSAVHTTGKTQGDIMREATQKFAQG